MQHRGRVLCSTSNFPRWEGDSTTSFVLHLAEDLQDIGWKVDVLAPHAPGAASEEVMHGVSVERFRYMWPDRLQTVCYQGGAMVNLRKRPLEKLKLPILIVCQFISLMWRLLTRKYDVIHSHWILPQGFTGMLASKLTGVPHVITVHGGDIFSLKGSIMERFKRAALHNADAVTVNSSFTEEAVVKVGPHIKVLRRLPMGVDVSPLTDAEKATVSQLRSKHHHGDGPLLIFVGRLVQEKGCEDAIRAVVLLKEVFPTVNLLVLGDGQDKESMHDLVRSLAVVDNVDFLGWVETTTIRAYMAAADVFLGPSRTSSDGWVEAQGLTFIEAMVVGTPVVASRLGGIVDSVIHEKTGLLVDEGSPEQIAKAVERLVSDADLKNAIATLAYTRAREIFARDISAANFSTTFSHVADESKAS